MQADAILSRCRNYRYGLWRVWDESQQKVLFIGLNPARADEATNDNTITRCMSYAKQWGYGGMLMGNLFAFRTPYPKVLKQANNPVGDENDRWLKYLAAEAGLIVGMWGNAGIHLNRAQQVTSLFPNLHCLAVTKIGQPHHTRGLPDGLKAMPYNGS